VGFIGLGHMGLPMAENLLQAGFELTVFNRSRSKADALRGARVAKTPAEVVQAAEMVLASLGNVAASLEIFLGPEGVVPAARPGQVLVDHSTVDVETSQRIYAAARARNAFFLDAPVSGGAEGARAATLSLMIGGDAEAFEKALPVLRNLGTTVVHLGPSGAGTAAKLANQLLVGVHSIACAEALALAQGLGVDGEKLLQVLQRSWGQSRVLERNGPRVVGGDWGPSATPVRNLRKDLGLIEAAATKARLTLPAASIARAVFQRLEAEGHGESDIAAASLVVARPPETKS
jgi:3-hydroxyisobutyrate dehydrogenase-like beta-hydroxyacid dehydrogenase